MSITLRIEAAQYKISEYHLRRNGDKYEQYQRLATRDQRTGTPQTRLFYKMAAGPFLVKLYYRTGAFHRTDEFATVNQLPFISAHTLSTCTLTDLSFFLADAHDPVVLPSPAIGTRIAFRLVQLNEDDTRDGSNAPPRVVIKDLGSVVIGGGGPGAPTSLSALAAVDDYDFGAAFDAPQGEEAAEAADGNDRTDRNDDNKHDKKTLADVHFAPGNFISCAIMPPMANGCVVPASNIRSGRGSGIGEASNISVRPPPPPPSWNRGARGSHYSSEKDYRNGRRRRSNDGMRPSFGAGRRSDAPSDQDIWVRDGGRSGPIGGNGGGGSGWPGSRRRRNGR